MNPVSGPAAAPGAIGSSRLKAKRRALMAELARIRGGQDKLAWLVDRGRALPSFAPALRVVEHLVPGCLARVWDYIQEFAAAEAAATAPPPP